MFPNKTPDEIAAELLVKYADREDVTEEELRLCIEDVEPLMNWDVVKELVQYARSVEKQHNKNFCFALTTNGMLIDDDVIDFANRELYSMLMICEKASPVKSAKKNRRISTY